MFISYICNEKVDPYPCANIQNVFEKVLLFKIKKAWKNFQAKIVLAIKANKVKNQKTFLQEPHIF